MICKDCGSILQNGLHTDDYVRSWVKSGKTTRPRLYRIWSAMRTRCTNPNHNSYKYYGARGLGICSEWSDYRVFRQWALSNGYQPDLKVERRNNDKGYYPENCCWATDQEQMLNRRLIKRAEHGNRYSQESTTFRSKSNGMS